MVHLTALAARIHEPGGSEVIVLEEVEVPALARSEVRVAVAVAGVGYGPFGKIIISEAPVCLEEVVSYPYDVP